MRAAGQEFEEDSPRVTLITAQAEEVMLGGIDCAAGGAGGMTQKLDTGHI